MIGSVLDKYEVLQKLGEGATATVYRGRHRTIGNDVAIKVLHPYLSASTQYRERFNREARAVGRLSHQNIVSILDYSGTQADDCYIVTELIDGVTILTLLHEHGAMPSEIAALLGIELCHALGFAHTQNIIHRDLKPENAMIRRDGRVKLMDFGVARVLDEGSITLDGSLLGSPAYMSPQQALDEPLDGRSDLFSLGTLLFHAVTGHVPFAGGNASVILRNIIEGNRPDVLELAPTVSPSLAAVIDRLLQPRPEQRYESAEAARQALLACLDEVRVGLDHPVINLRTYVVDVRRCVEALDAHLRLVLLERGKERLASGDHLGALQLFNRLLAVDEDHPEVLSLIQSLHQAPALPTRARWALPAVGLAVLLTGVAAWAWVRTGQPEGDPRPEPGAEVTLAEPPELLPGEDPEPSGVSGENLPAAPPPLPSPSPAVAVTRIPSGRAPEPRRAVAAPVEEPAASREPARVVITSSVPAEVYLDGLLVGKTREGPPSAWVGSRQRPLELPAGTHTVTLVNPHAERAEETFQVGAGELKELPFMLKRLPVLVSVHPQVPDDCELSVGGRPYGTVRDQRLLRLRDPDPDTELVFTCPDPPGVLRDIVGPTSGGESLIRPRQGTTTP